MTSLARTDSITVSQYLSPIDTRLHKFLLQVYFLDLSLDQGCGTDQQTFDNFSMIYDHFDQFCILGLDVCGTERSCDNNFPCNNFGMNRPQFGTYMQNPGPEPQLLILCYTTGYV